MSSELLTWHDKRLDFTRVFYPATAEIPYPHREGLASKDGTHFDLLVPKAVSREEIKKFIRQLRSERDVVSYAVFRGEPQCQSN